MNPAVTIAAGIAVWLVTAFLKREHWPSDVNLLLTMVVAAVAGLALVGGQDAWAGTPLSWSHWTQYATADFAVATLIYGVLTVRVPGLRQAAQGIARLTSSPTALSAAASALPSTTSPSPSITSPSMLPADSPALAMAASVAPAPASTRAPASASPAAVSARVSASSRSTRRPSEPSSNSTPSLSSALSALSALVASAPGPVPAEVGMRTQVAPVISGPIPGTRRSERTTRGRALGQFPPLQPGS
jgi:hypothetical protein